MSRATTMAAALAVASALLAASAAAAADSSVDGVAGAAGGSEAPVSAPAQPVCDERCGYDAMFHRSTVGFGVAIGVTQISEMDGINQRLARAGWAELPHVGPHLSLSVPLSVERFTLLTQIRLYHLGGAGESTELDAYQGTFSFGYSLTPPELLALYPFAGIGIGAAELTVGRPSSGGGSFDGALTTGRGGLDLSTMAFLGTVGVAADLLLARTADHPTRGLFVGLRTGYTAAFVHSDWSLGPEEGDVTDGPAPPMSGWYGEFAFGLRF